MHRIGLRFSADIRPKELSKTECGPPWAKRCRTEPVAPADFQAIGCEFRLPVNWAHQGALLLPAAAEGPVELDQRKQLVPPGLRETQLGIEQVAVGIQSVEKCIDSSSIPHVGQTRPVLQRAHEQFLLRADLFDFAMLNERVRDLSERRLDYPFILNQSDLLLRSGQRDVRSDSAALKIGWVTWGTNCHARVGPLNRLDS